MVRVADRLAAARWCSTPICRSANATWMAACSVDRGTIYDFLALVMSNAALVKPPARGEDPASDPKPRIAPVCSSSTRPGGRGATWRHHYDLDGRLYALPRPRPAIFLRLFRDARRHARRGAARQEAPSRRQARARAGPARARHRLGLGRPRPLSRRARRRRRHRRHAFATSSCRLQRAAPRRRVWPTASRFLLAGLSRGRRAVRPHRLGRHVRACRHQSLPTLLPRPAATCSPTTASWSSTPSAASTGPATPMPGSTSTSSPAATSRRFRRSCRRSSGPA